MNISKYQIFLKVVSCGSFSKAAEALSFTQSGISHAINSLENELGVMLLSRNRGGVVLTADGRAVLPKIEELCAAHHALMQTVEGLKDMDSSLKRRWQFKYGFGFNVIPSQKLAFLQYEFYDKDNQYLDMQEEQETKQTNSLARQS